MSEPVVAIVVAAGSGVRLGASTAGGSGPKALRRLRDVALVRWSADAMATAGCGEVIVVCSSEWESEFRQELAGVNARVRYVAGGATRQESVAHGLLEARRCHGDSAIVLVHDAARPLVPKAVTQAVIQAVRDGAAAVVPAVPVIDSLRERDAHGSQVVDRSRYVAVQTPQGFRLGALLAAHQSAENSASFTDDAAVCEAAGYGVFLVEGSRRSLKITEPVDFALAEAILQEEE